MNELNLACADCAKGDEARPLDQDGVLSSISGERGEMAHAYDDSWGICVGAYTHESALVEISRLMDLDPPLGTPDANKLVALADAVRVVEAPLRAARGIV